VKEEEKKGKARKARKGKEKNSKKPLVSHFWLRHCN